MLPRLKLIQCFTCNHNLECWGLTDSIPLGMNEQTSSISQKALTFFVTKNLDKDMNIGEQFGILCLSFMSTLRYDHGLVKRDALQLISMLCAFCNTDSDSWECPGETETGWGNFVFESRSEV